jgi:UDP-N-acetylglucosamine acyltransferase
MPGVHATAVVDSSARLARDVEIGPYAVVGEDVVLGEGTRLFAHAMVLGPATLGRENVVHAFAVVGGAPQLKERDRDRASRLTLGDRNVVREHVTIHRGSDAGVTRVGDDNLFMVGAHVAHDALVGSHVTLANGAQLAGHAVVEDYATFGGLSGVAQFVRVGESAFVAAGAMCERSVPPFVIVQGDRARVRALNVVGLRRRGVPEDSIACLSAAFRELFAGGETLQQALQSVPRGDPYVARLVAALQRPQERSRA